MRRGRVKAAAISPGFVGAWRRKVARDDLNRLKEQLQLIDRAALKNEMFTKCLPIRPRRSANRDDDCM
jgi:hypothetical protein